MLPLGLFYSNRGVILFSMLNGYLPFDESRIGDMQERMRTQRFTFVRGLSHGKLQKALFGMSRLHIKAVTGPMCVLLIPQVSVAGANVSLNTPCS